MSERPNVLLIVMDQFRGDLLHSSPLALAAKLPRMRELMTDAVTFDRHFSVTAPCGPSRVSLLTGQYAMNHRAVRNGTPARHDMANLATAARAAGYLPQLFGYTDHAQDPRVVPADDPRLQSYEELAPGFDETLRMRMDSDDQDWRDHCAAQGNPLPPFPETYRPNGDQINDPAQYSAENSDTAYLTDRFLHDMNDADPGWFATVTYVRPHPPLVAPEPYNKMFNPADMPPALMSSDPRGNRDWHPFIAPTQDRLTPRGMVMGLPDVKPSADTTAALRAVYLGLCAELDHHIGRIIDWLKATDQWDTTILAVTSDHGEMLGDFDCWGKDTFHDAAFHVPLIYRDPTKPKGHGQRVLGMTESIDLAPTLLDAMDAGIPHSMNGATLTSLLDDPTQPAKPITMSEYDFGNPVIKSEWMRQLKVPSSEASLCVIRTDQHRLVHFAADIPTILFDMDSEGELLDQSNRPDAPAQILELTQSMLSYRMKNAESTFAKTIVGNGVRIGTH